MPGLSLRTRVLLSALIPLPLVALAAVVIWQAFRASEAADAAVADGYARIADLNGVVKLALDAETGERGYVITGNEAFLEPFRSGLREFGTKVADLKASMAGAPPQRDRLGVLDALFRRWSAEVAQPTIDARRAVPIDLVTRARRLLAAVARLRLLPEEARPALRQELGRQLVALLAAHPGIRGWETLEKASAALIEPKTPPLELVGAESRLVEWVDQVEQSEIAVAKAIVEGRGKALMDELRGQVAELSRLEKAGLEASVRRAERWQEDAKLSMVGAMAAALLLSALLAVMMIGAVSRSLRSVTDAAMALADGDLARRAVVRSKDEVGQLGKTFNLMAGHIEDRERAAARLHQLGALLQTCLDLSEAHEVISRIGPELFPGRDGALFMLNPSETLAERQAGWGAPVPDEPVFAPEACWALRSSQPHASSPSAVSCRHLKGEAFRTALCLPVTAHRQPLGVLVLRGELQHAFAAEERRLAETVAEQLALALGNLKLREKLHDQAVRDPLTHLFNRRYLEETLQRESDRVRRKGASVGVMVLDVDHFKRFNDTYGHDAGDALLVQIGRLLASAFRGADLACRFGGEEFVVVLVDSDLENTARRAEQLRLRVRELRVVHAGQPLGAVSVSIGVASLPFHGEAWQEVIKAADLALYEAKRGGRDQVRTAAK